MSQITVTSEPFSRHTEPAHREDFAAKCITHAAHLLPAQGPISVFIHHNTLHAFEKLSFDEAVAAGAQQFGCEPYLSEERYRSELRRGRIQLEDLRAALAEELGPSVHQKIAGLADRFDLRLAMLLHPLWEGTGEELDWFVGETDAIRKARPEMAPLDRARLISETRHWVLRDLRREQAPPEWFRHVFEESAAECENWGDAGWEAFSLKLLWEICQRGVRKSPGSGHAHQEIRHRDLLIAAGGTDIDDEVNDILIRFSAAYLDQGLAECPLPNRDAGYWASFVDLYGRNNGLSLSWLEPLPDLLQQMASLSPLEAVIDSLDHLKLPMDEWEPYLTETLLALPGWAGMLEQFEERSDRVARPVAQQSLFGYVAVRLVLERLALAHGIRALLNRDVPISQLQAETTARSHSSSAKHEQKCQAFRLFQLAQVMGWLPRSLSELSETDWSKLLAEVNSFGSVDRRRVFQKAYEIRFGRQTLDAIALHQPKKAVSGRPRFQAVFCLDEREESFRRHLEELAPDVETFGAAGFFSVAMYYKGVEDAHFVPQCPIVIRPNHWVEERLLEEHRDNRRFQVKARKTLGKASLKLHRTSRSSGVGSIVAGVLGGLATIPLVARILFPRLTARFSHLAHRAVRIPKEETEMLVEKPAEPGSGEDRVLGFSLTEMADIGERLLRDMGLTKNLAQLVFIVGHGSNSFNNPHKSAYDCGACGGSPGEPNSRAIAKILNHPRVRIELEKRKIDIPDDTWFIGGYHNTCDDSVEFTDTQFVPTRLKIAFEKAACDFKAASKRNAHERCRRFMSAPLSLGFDEAHAHVQGRSVDLAQTRPELGHATNAICIVGRRNRTRGLFFDRRAFLTSYDPTTDGPDSPILTRILQAVVPVCSGINLEYYFSRVDSQRYGCGTKLPHNITSLIGVMDGAASDLRTGLPWQMVEIHEPVRLIFVLESTVSSVQRILERNPAIAEVIKKEWVHLTVLDPNSQAISVWKNGQFQEYQPHAESLPRATSSIDWYQGYREHLEFAEIGDF